MADIAISARHVSKQYVIASVNHDTLRDRIAHACRSAFGKSVTNEEGPRTFHALNDVSFDVTEGEVLGIIGHNGAGKSTLLKVLSRITEPSDGEIDIYGRVTSLLEVGTGFHAELTGRENIYLNAAMLGMRKVDIDRRLEEIVEFSGTQQFIDTPVKRYSSGMYVRLAFSVAAHLDPEILIVDEVLSVGDGAFQKKCLGKMDEVRRDGRTVILVSHDLPVHAQLVDRIAVMYVGKIVEMAESDALLRHPLHPYTEALVSAVPPADPDMRMQRIILEGDVPSPANPPSGCVFHPRCRYAQDVCKQQVPLLEEVEPGHYAACHFARELTLEGIGG